MSTKPTLRPAEPEDLTALASLYRAAVHGLGSAHYTPGQLQSWAAFADEEKPFARFVLGAHTLVAEHDGVPVGFGGLARDGHLTALYVHPDHAGRGLGTRIAEALLELARRWHLGRVYVEASALSRATFARLGFRVEEVETVERRGSTFRRYRMAVDL